MDDQPAQRLSIEKMLNQQGYHRIAPVACFKELQAMLENAIEPFDLLLINSDLAADFALDLDDFFRHCPAIRHTLIYKNLPLHEQVMVLAPSSKVIKTLSRPPDNQALKNLMQMIDPQKSKATRRPWLRKVH
ncbi:chemotaxis protein CheY [Pseudomonas sp. 15FMM2]|uniref:Chemotaxis protein CheY n=1 Tax=Pseudomonas imrae TaxID=2992837 RepID=A0ACC7PAB0_9PSED